jgi:hypothetical protein
MVDVTKVANFEKKVPADWITEDGMHVNEKFERYARPLILDEVTPVANLHQRRAAAYSSVILK